MIIRKVRQIGTSKVLTLPHDLCDITEIDEDSVCQVSLDETKTKMIIAPVRAAKHEQAQANTPNVKGSVSHAINIS